MGKASILIPSPNVAENHQYHNGKVLADMGAAVLIEEKDLTDRAIVSAFESMYSDTTKTKQMGELARNAYQQDCLDIIYKNLNL
jgi:UDP-N-acetylglucosamine--N-acetylmuramyl-(pentapeptide) pyrophosphoryl-undecaprenol N-acetylglucosamine transferase